MNVLDEPTEGLAPIIVEQFAAGVISACEQTGAPLLLPEQNLRFAQRCTDWVYVIDSGQIVLDGDWPTLQANPQIEERSLVV